MSVNRVILIGRSVRDCDSKFTPSGSHVVRFTLAVDRGRKDANGNKETDFIRCSTWNKQADICEKWLTKGRLVCIEGSLRINETEHEGQRRQYVEVVCDRVTFLDSGKDKVSDNNGGVDGQPAEQFGTEVPNDDDVPFN